MSVVVTLELGIRQMRVVEVQNRKPVRFHEIALPDGAFNDGMPTRIFTQALTDRLKAFASPATAALVGISDAGVAVRDFVLPKVPAGELVSTVTYEARRIVPMDATDVYFAWHASATRRGYDVYVAAARREMIDALIASVASSGLAVQHIDLAALAIARGAHVAGGLVLDWGLSESTLVLIVAGRPRFLRTFLLERSADDPAQFDELMTSAQALIRFLRTSEQALPLGSSTPLLLTGRLATFPQAEAQVRAALELDARRGAPPAAWPAALPWESCLGSVGLLQAGQWRPRIRPGQGGDNRVAA